MQPLLSEDHGDLRIMQHEGKPLDWVSWLNWYVCAACLHHRKNGNHHLEGAMHVNADPDLGSDMHLLQLMCQLIATLIEILIGKMRVLKRYRDAMRRARSLLRDELVQKCIPRILC